ncbi:MAG: hypothetical protein WKF70_08125, partial [Chitinophagaceae bacterium]
NYDGKATVSALQVNGQQVISNSSGIYSEVRTARATYSTQRLASSPRVLVKGNTVTVSGIVYGGEEVAITEKWKFTIGASDIKYAIDRSVSKDILLEASSFPTFHFDSVSTWEGAYQGYGGVAWFYLFNERLATYGVHTNSSRFWNSKTGNGLTVAVNAPGREVAMKYSRTADDQLAYHVTVSPKEMIPRFDSGTNRKRFIRQRTDVWAAHTVAGGTTSGTITLSWFDFNEVYGRGKFPGMNGTQLSSVLNTIARIGVIDKKHFGGNSWHTPYGPICLHEQYIAQLGLAINDDAYLKGYEECLDFYRDNAMKPDGRVWSRWAYNNVDIMPGQVTDKGFYEAQWGFLLDANPDFVTNVVELYDQTGNKAWIKNHQLSCEKALDWLIKRDTDGDGLVEMMTDSHKEKRGSDWIDIIWAAYENAFVNAKLYFALVKWAAVEQQLGNSKKARSYRSFAAKLKASFNKPTTEGGFWDVEKGCYVHWLDKDRSIHGRGMVTPVNFMAIAYGIVDDAARSKAILDAIEVQMEKEKLFFWPLNLFSYEPGEGNDWQFPFPAYENGDIFLSWGAVAVKAYADYKPELALKYVRNVMSRHSIDGLAFQRYGRVKQDGLGDDILSGNSLSVVGLYQAIYGINPLYNRFYLNPHITPELAGTELNYGFRGQRLKISLNPNWYSVSSGKYKLTAPSHFGFYQSGTGLSYFHGSSAAASINVQTGGAGGIDLSVTNFTREKITWRQAGNNASNKKLVYTIHALAPGSYYTILVNGKKQSSVRSSVAGSIAFNHTTSTQAQSITITRG